MVIYGVALTPLMETVRGTLPTVLQAWYTYDSSFQGITAEIAPAMQIILEKGPARGYYLEPRKSVLICNLAIHKMVQAGLQEFNFQFESRYCHVGRYLGSQEAHNQWIQPQIQQWVRGMEHIAQVAPQFPQMAFAGLTKSLQLEWQYLQQVIPRTSPVLTPIKEAIATTFLPALLAESTGAMQNL